MSKIIATDHFETQNWEVTFDDLAPHYADLFIGFTDDAPVVEFKDSKFKYELKQGDNIKQYGVFPPPNTRYVRTDQAYIVVERLNLLPDRDYVLYLWAENDGKTFEREVTFTTPKPAQPYPSWTWDGDQWKAPVAYPEDGEVYLWDEETQEWKEPVTETINVNTAEYDELRKLHGVDKVRAQAIIDGRDWENANDLTNIQGISQSMVDSWDIEV